MGSVRWCRCRTWSHTCTAPHKEKKSVQILQFEAVWEWNVVTLRYANSILQTHSKTYLKPFHPFLCPGKLLTCPCRFWHLLDCHLSPFLSSLICLWLHLCCFLSFLSTFSFFFISIYFHRHCLITHNFPSATGETPFHFCWARSHLRISSRTSRYFVPSFMFKFRWFLRTRNAAQKNCCFQFVWKWCSSFPSLIESLFQTQQLKL